MLPRKEEKRGLPRTHLYRGEEGAAERGDTATCCPGWPPRASCSAAGPGPWTALLRLLSSALDRLKGTTWTFFTQDFSKRFRFARSFSLFTLVFPSATLYVHLRFSLSGASLRTQHLVLFLPGRPFSLVVLPPCQQFLALMILESLRALVV